MSNPINSTICKHSARTKTIQRRGGEENLVPVFGIEFVDEGHREAPVTGLKRVTSTIKATKHATKHVWWVQQKVMDEPWCFSGSWQAMARSFNQICPVCTLHWHSENKVGNGQCVVQNWRHIYTITNPQPRVWHMQYVPTCSNHVQLAAHR